MKKVISLFLSLLIAGTFSFETMALSNPATEKSVAEVKSASAGNYNYGEAMQKAIMFYEFQRSGKMTTDQRNNWRGDSGMNDGSDVQTDLTGGYYDAGDNVKFNLPMSYTAAMLAWDIYENKAALETSGQLDYLKTTIKWATDYFIKCHPSPNVYYYQVGNGNKDHSWWGASEVMQMERPTYTIDAAHPGSTVCGETAAALAAASIIFKEDDPEYAALCLRHAKELYTFADTTRDDKGYTEANGFYDSWSGFADELSWAGTWLYLATDDEEYLTKAEAAVSLWGKQGQSDDIAYQHTQCWDDVHYGAELLLARITGKSIYKEAMEHNLDWWTTGYNGAKIDYTPKGLAWLSQWGSLRYATTAAFIASIYSKSSCCTPSKVTTYQNFAKSQIDYALGSSGRSYEVGFGENAPKHPHHRTAQGSWADNMDTPNYHRHNLIGALVGGPDVTDGYEDKVSDYTKNEVACDYNAGFICALTELYGEYGGTPIANLNAMETPTNNEFFVEASVNAYGNNFEEIKAMLYNESGWPAKVAENLSYKYFVDISELVKAGYSAKDVTVKTNYNAGATVTGLIPFDPAHNIYYVNVDFTGTKIYPGGQSAYKKECQFRISYPENVNVWDNSNDWSYVGINKTAGGTPLLAENIPVYDNGVLIFGNEPSNDNSSISPMAAAFDRAAGEQEDLSIAVNFNGNTLVSIKNGTDVLTSGTDYTVTADGVVISKDYLAERDLGAANLVFTFSKGAAQALKVTVIDSSIMDSEINPTTAIFDKDAENQSDVDVTMTLNGNTLTSIKNGASALVEDEDYEVNGNVVTIKKEYLAEKPLGKTTLTFNFNQGASKSIEITVKDSSVPTPQGDLRVEMFNGMTQSETNGIAPRFRIVNAGDTAVDLSNVTLRYYYTKDNDKAQTFWCDWSSAGTANVTGTFVDMAAPAEDADSYLEISFSSAAGTLAPGANIEVQARFSKTDWSNYNQANDYSFDAEDNSYTASNKVTAYLDGSLIFGIEP